MDNRNEMFIPGGKEKYRSTDNTKIEIKRGTFTEQIKWFMG
jgi:hypothetical protein